MGRDPAEIRADLELAGQTLARGFQRLRERGLIAPLLVLTGAVAAIVSIRRRPVAEVARKGKRALDTTLDITAALAAIERYRRRKRAA